MLIFLYIEDLENSFGAPLILFLFSALKMSQNFENTMNEWLGSLSKFEKREFDNMNLEVLVSLRFLNLDFNFLHASISMWDPNNHVFRFKTH